MMLRKEGGGRGREGEGGRKKEREGSSSSAALGENRNDDQGKKPTLEHRMASKGPRRHSVST